MAASDKLSDLQTALEAVIDATPLGTDINPDVLSLYSLLRQAQASSASSGGSSPTTTAWTEIRSFSPPVSSETNTAPITFTAIDSAPTTYNEVAFALDNITASQAISNAIFYIWSNQGSKNNLIATITAIPDGANNGALSGTASVQVDRVFSAATGFGVKVAVNPASTVFTVDPTSDLISFANQGYSNTQQVNLATTGVLPRGLGGDINATDIITGVGVGGSGVFSPNGVTFVDAESVRLNLSQIGTSVIPPSAGWFRPGSVDLVNSTITLTYIPKALTIGSSVRFRAPNGSTLPTGLSATTTYTVVSVSGSATQPTIAISADGISRFQFTNPGVGYIYCFEFPYCNATWNNNIPSINVDGSAISVQYEYESPVTVTGGTAALLTFASAHGLSDNTAIRIGGTTLPGGIVAGDTYYARTTGTATTLNVALESGGTPIAFSTAGSGVTVQVISTGTVLTTSSVTAGTAATLTTPFNHQLGTNTTIRLSNSSGTNLPGGATQGKNYYVTAAGTGTTLSISSAPGKPNLTFSSAGANVVVSATNVNGSIPIERTTAFIRDVSGNSCKLAATSGGTAIDITGTNNFVHTLSPVGTATISGAVIARAING